MVLEEYVVSHFTDTTEKKISLYLSQRVFYLIGKYLLLQF